MMDLPNKYSPSDLQTWDVTKEDPKTGEWVPSRPICYFGLSLMKRLKLTWGVFIGKYDVLDWEE